MLPTTTRTRVPTLGALLLAVGLGACVEQSPSDIRSPLIPPEAPDNPKIISAAWNMDVDRNKREISIKAPTAGLNEGDLQILADYFGVQPGSPDLSILAGDVVEIIADNASFSSSPVGAFAPGLVRTTFNVSIRNRLNVVNIATPTFPAPPPGTSGVVLFPFEIVVTSTPGGVTGGQGDGTDVIVELPNRGQVAPSVDWDVAPFNFFNDSGCSAGSNGGTTNTASDCYRSETFSSTGGAPLIAGGATSESRQIGFDHDPTVSQFRVRMIVAGDIENATPNTPPVADAHTGAPDNVYNGARGVPFNLSGGATDPDPGSSIVAFRWDFDADGAYDDATGATAQFTCAAAGPVIIDLQVEDDRGALDTDVATVNCTDSAPSVDAGGPYTGFVGTAITLSATGTDDGTLTFAWDLNNDGTFETPGQSVSFTCSATGAQTVVAQVTDDALQSATDIATVNCATAPQGTIRTRWVDASGAPITSAAVGSDVFLEVDVELTPGNDIFTVAGHVLYNNAVLDATDVTDLVCNAGNNCPSAQPVPAGNIDRMNQQTGNPDRAPNRTDFSNFHVSLQTAIGIQGLARMQFSAIAAGAVNPVLNITVAQNLAETDLTLNVLPVPPLTIN